MVIEAVFELLISKCIKHKLQFKFKSFPQFVLTINHYSKMILEIYALNGKITIMNKYYNTKPFNVEDPELVDNLIQYAIQNSSIET